MPATTITSIGHYLRTVRAYTARNPEHAIVRYWFRGQSDVEWPLSPGVYRKEWPNNEDDRIQKERHIVAEFRHLATHLIPSGTGDVESYFLQQHYGVPTRLLDWTTNPLSSLFFALNEPTKDGRVFMMDAYQTVGSEGIASARRKEVRHCIRCLFDWSDYWPSHIMAVRPTSVEVRIRAQSGFFTLHPKSMPELTTAQNPSLEEVVIPRDLKPTLRRNLDLLGIDEFAIYGDLENLAKRLKRAFGV